MSELSDLLLPWFRVSARALPWRENKDPYAVWVSEIMLQQTQIETVKGYYSAFLKRFPSVKELALSSEDEVLKSWEGLGYYSRAKNLLKAARIIYFDHNGTFPSSKKEWMELPGVGDYASSSIASICFDQKCVALDGNLFRVFCRLTETERYFDGSSKKLATAFYQSQLPERGSGDFNQALMEIGETLCLSKADPACCHCPLSLICNACLHSSYHKFPLPKPAKQKGRVSIFVFIIEFNQMVLIRKREEDGLLSKLYEFPIFPSLEDAEKALIEGGFDFLKAKELGGSIHEFSHVAWDMRWFYICADESMNLKGYQYVPLSQLHEKIALPNAFTNFLKKKHICGF